MLKNRLLLFPVLLALLVCAMPARAARADTPGTAIPWCDGVTDGDLQDRNVVYWSYTGQERYVFCCVSEFPIFVEHKYTDNADREFYIVMPWDGSKRVYNGNHTSMYYYDALSGVWLAPSGNLYYIDLADFQGFVREMYESGDFLVMYSNHDLGGKDFSSDGIYTEGPLNYSTFTPSALSFPAAPASATPGLVPAQGVLATAAGQAMAGRNQIVATLVSLAALLIPLSAGFVGLRKALTVLRDLLFRA